MSEKVISGHSSTFGRYPLYPRKRIRLALTIIGLSLTLSACGHNTIPTLQEQAKVRWSCRAPTPLRRAGGTRSRHMYRCAGGWGTLRYSRIESSIEGLEVTMAKGQMRSNREKKKPKQDKNKKKGAEAPSPFAGMHCQVKLGTSYTSQYGKKH